MNSKRLTELLNNVRYASNFQMLSYWTGIVIGLAEGAKPSGAVSLRLFVLMNDANTRRFNELMAEMKPAKAA